MLAVAHTELIATIAVSLSAALVLGYAARSLRLSPIVGYMLAGVLVGPHTPGFVADQALAEQLAEIGIALLMFGVGLHFSLDDLLAVRRIAIPGAIGQSLLATGCGALLGIACGWGLGAGVVFGLALSVASTVVLIRGLTDQKQLESMHGHVAVGWLVVEDLFTVLILVLLPAWAGTGEQGLATAGLWTLVKLAGLGLLYVAGVRLVPWFLQRIARLQSRELFTLAVLGIALGIAYGSAVVFSVSMALGAFLGGMIVGRSDLSHQAAADALPLRDAFAVLFFVSVGMLFDPEFLLTRPWLVLGTIAIVIVVKPLAAFAIAIADGYPVRTGLTVAAGLGQIGEFSFILGALGVQLGVLPAEATQALVAAALASIALNPLFFAVVAPLQERLQRWPALARLVADKAGELGRVTPARSSPRGHVVLCGHGRSGRLLARLLRERQWPFVVVEQDRATVVRLRADGIDAIHGDAANATVLEHAGVADCKVVVVTLPDPLATRQIVDHVRAVAPAVDVVARVNGEAERSHLGHRFGVAGVIAETELAVELARHVLHRFGISSIEAQAIALDLRRGEFRPQRGAKVLEVRIAEGSPAVGKALAQLSLGKGVLVMAIDRGGELLVPHGQTTIAAGDLLLLIGEGEHAARIAAAL
jgi:CPA2 family monovalent cation:H+ antiporter-2